MKFDQVTNIWREIEVGLVKQEWGKDFIGKKVLDLGCGEGEIAKEVFGGKCNKGQSFVTGLDNDEGMVRKARKSGVYKEVVLADAGEMPFADGEFEVMFSNSVLEHISKLERVLREVSRVLKPGGLLVATMPSDQLISYIGWGKLYGFLFNKKYNHYHLYSREKWVSLLKKFGLKLVDSYYYLDTKTIGEWHKCLWLNKLGISFKVEKRKFMRLKSGAALAIKVRKL